MHLCHDVVLFVVLSCQRAAKTAPAVDGAFRRRPQPYTLVPTAAMSFILLTVIAVWFGIAEAYLAAAFCFGMTYLLVFHLFTGRITWHVATGGEIVRVMLSAVTGNAMIGLVALLGLASGGLAVWKRPRGARYVAVVASVVAVASLGLVTLYGFGQAGDPNGVTWVYGIYAAMALIAVVATRHPLAAWASVVLSFLTIAQAVVFRYAEVWTLHRWIVALLVHATVVLVLAGLGRYVWARVRVILRSWDVDPLLADPWCAAGLLDTLVVVLLLVGQFAVVDSTPNAVHVAWLGTVWLALAGLSILGILAGMALRVRAFLFLGTSFLLISLMTMIWYAAVDLHQTWLWFVTGIVAGVVIIAVFALFEKKREDVLRVVEQLKEWDA